MTDMNTLWGLFAKLNNFMYLCYMKDIKDKILDKGYTLVYEN